MHADDPAPHPWLPALSAELEMECAKCGTYIGMAADLFDPAEVRCGRHSATAGKAAA